MHDQIKQINPNLNTRLIIAGSTNIYRTIVGCHPETLDLRCAGDADITDSCYNRWLGDSNVEVLRSQPEMHKKHPVHIDKYVPDKT